MSIETIKSNPMTGVKTQAVFNHRGEIEKIVATQSGAGGEGEAAAKLAKHAEDNQGTLIGSQNHRQQIAEIPSVVVNDLINRGIWGDTPKLLKWLQFEGQVFRATAGRLI
jgi:hypothetical protein